MDMRFYWVKDRTRQVHFFVYRGPVKTNKADYFTKHHPPRHHTTMRREYLNKSNHIIRFIPPRGCINHRLGLTSPNISHEPGVPKTCSSPRRTFFLHALSFQCTSKLCGTFLNQFSDYFHIKKMHNTI